MAEIQKSKVVIHLMGRNYTLLTREDPAQVQRVARYVDRKMRETAIASRAGDAMALTLTALTLGGELLRAQDENVRLKKELAALRQPDQNA